MHSPLVLESTPLLYWKTLPSGIGKHSHLGFFCSPLFEQSSLLWSDPVGAQQRQATALRCRAPLNSGVMQVEHGTSGG